MASKIHVVLRPVKSIVVRFCPFESNVESTRNFLGCINHKRIQATNKNCEVTADVRHDGSEPLVDVMFADYLTSKEFAALDDGKHGAGTWMPYMVLQYMGLSMAFVFANLGKKIIDLVDGDRLIMKGANLTTAEMLTALGTRCNAKEIKEEQKSKKKSP